MYCTACGTKTADDSLACPQCGKPNDNAGSGLGYGDVPDGVKGWSWGAFLLNWVWAVGNRTWIGLLALVPYVGVLVAIWLGIKGREMAWKNGHWQSVEHFNRVQRAWSRWAVGLTLGMLLLGVVAAIVIPAYQDYVMRARAHETVSVQPAVQPAVSQRAALGA
jgi:hypothetical protein